jgi:hypothetical protein
VSLPVRIESGGKELRINGEGEIGVVVHTHPPFEEESSGLPFFGTLANSSASTDMRVDGSSSSVDFYIEAQSDKDTYIKTVMFTIADASATLDKFGNITALTNGCDFIWKTQARGEVSIKSAMKSNWDFIKLARGNPSFGDGASAFRANNVVGTSEGYLPVVDFDSLFGNVWGLRLKKGSKDRLILRINDDISTPSVDEFTAEVSGLKF